MAVEEMPAAVHLNLLTNAEDGGDAKAGISPSATSYAGRIIVNNPVHDEYGGGQAHNNVTPAKAVYAWLRMA